MGGGSGGRVHTIPVLTFCVCFKRQTYFSHYVQLEVHLSASQCLAYFIHGNPRYVKHSQVIFELVEVMILNKKRVIVSKLESLF